MSSVANTLRDRRLNVWTEARAIVEKAAEEHRDMSSEEEGSWSRMMEELDKIDGRLSGVLSSEKRSKDTDDAFNSIVSRKSGSTPLAAHAQKDGGDLNAEIRALIKGELRNDKGHEVRAMEFRHQNGTLGQQEFRSLVSNSGSPTAIIPIDFYDQLLAYLIEVSGIMQTGPTVLNTAGGESLLLPQATVHTTVTAVAAQGQSIVEIDPTFAQKTLAAYKYGSLIQVARELIDDTSVDLLGYLAMSCGRAVGNKFGSDLINGAGSGAPSGLVFATSASPAVTGGISTSVSGWGATGAPSYSKLIDMEYSVIAPYRQSRSCYWLAADKTVGGLRKLTDANGRPVWEPSTVLGTPDLLLGKPLVADPYVPAVAAGAFSLFFGDFAQFFVRLVGGVRFERSDDFQFGSDLVTFRCLIRGDGTLSDTNAVKCFQGGAT